MIKSWQTIRRIEGEKNAISQDTDQYNMDWFDIKHASGIRYPAELEQRPREQTRTSRDPFAHLGKIGYTRNTWQFKGPNKEENNIYGANHMKKTLWFEEMRRKIIAERKGIFAEIDESSIAGTGGAFYLREKRNKYLKVAPIVPLWTQIAPPNPISLQRQSKV